MSEVERALKNLNGYHEDILEALRTAASHSTHRGPPGGLGMHTPSGSSSLLSEEILRKSLLDRRSSRGGSQVRVFFFLFFVIFTFHIYLFYFRKKYVITVKLTQF